MLDEPKLSSVSSYRGIHALCTVNGEGELKASHYVCVLIGGSKPVWGCWTVRGKWLRFFGGRSQIEKEYPKLVWRRRMTTWGITDTRDKSVEERRQELKAKYGGEWPYFEKKER